MDNAKNILNLGIMVVRGATRFAAVTGDTVVTRSRCRWPSLHVVIKLLSTTILVLAPLFVSGPSSGSGSGNDLMPGNMPN